MVSEGWIAALTAALTAAGAARVEAVRGELAARVARAVVADIGDVRAEVVPEGVLIEGRGVRARAFGSRRRAADPRLAWLAAGLAARLFGGGY